MNNPSNNNKTGIKILIRSFLLTLLLILHVSFYFVVEYYQLPAWQTYDESLADKVQELRSSKELLYDKTGLTSAYAQYDEAIEKIRIIKNSRKRSFVFSGDSGFDFFPDIVGTIIPVISSHLHNSVTVEGIYIDQDARVVIPIFSNSYTILAKQYAVFKNAFEGEENSMFTNIKLNSFNRQDIEILERDSQNNLVKIKRRVNKAMIIAQINPDYFSTEELNGQLLEKEGFEKSFGFLTDKGKQSEKNLGSNDFENHKSYKRLYQEIQEAILIVWKNIKNDINTQLLK